MDLIIERGFAGKIECPNEIMRYHLRLGVLDLPPEDSDLMVMLTDRVRNVALADGHVPCEFKTPGKAICDLAATTMWHERLQAQHFALNPGRFRTEGTQAFCWRDAPEAAGGVAKATVQYQNSEFWQIDAGLHT